MQSWSVVSAPMRLDDDLDILIERHQKAQKALNGKLPEFASQHLGNVGLFDAEKVGSLNLLQAAIFHDRVDFENELRLDQVLFGIRHADVFEHIPAPGFVSRLPHCSLSFAICSATLTNIVMSPYHVEGSLGSRRAPPTTSHQPPATNNQPPTTNNQQPAPYTGL
jgi:hypothetical protein